MNLEDLGYDADLDLYRREQNLLSFEVGRVIEVHKERYIVRTGKNEFEAEITGNLRFSANSRSDFPAVGDWVVFSLFDENIALIHQILPRKTVLEREAVGKLGEKQLIAVNVDFAFLMQAVDRDFNLNRLERYLTICYSAKVEPIIVLSKIDLINDNELQNRLNEIKSRIRKVMVIPISNQDKAGYDKFKSTLRKGKTYCFLGSSGVGKSTLINAILGKEEMKTKTISLSTRKGRHTTTHRELFVLTEGGILIDNPGLREVGIADTADGLEITFETIFQLSLNCQFSDCTHTHEKGCAVLTALEKGELDKAAYANYLKMEREKKRFQSSIAEKRKKDKEFGKMCKDAMKDRKRKKF